MCTKDAEDKRLQTIELFDMLKNNKYKGYTSTVTIDEIKKAPEDIKEELLKVIERSELEILEHTEEAKALGQEYIKAGIIPEKYRDDAYHISVATVMNMHAIISWNFKHIVKMKTIDGVHGINIFNGYNPIGIYSPLEVIENVE